VTSSHTIAFTVPTGSTVAAADTITVTFPAGFTDVGSVSALAVTVDGSADAATAISVTGQEVSFAGIDATAGQEVIVVVADGIVTNPTTIGSYEFEIDTGNGDSGKTRVAIIDNVLVTAIVETTFDFTITGLGTTTDVNGEATTGSTTATEIPFGVLEAGTAETLGQALTVTTNAINGFVVTVRQDDDLQSSTGADIDSFIEGAYTNAPASWVVPSNDISDENTWGHWGLTSEDADLNSDEFGTQLFVAASTTPREIFSHDGPSNGSDANIGSTEVAYKIEITALQEAGDDYNTTLTYVATPTF